MEKSRTTTGVRVPAVAGRFYPSDADELRAGVHGLLQGVDRAELLGNLYEDSQKRSHVEGRASSARLLRPSYGHEPAPPDRTTRGALPAVKALIAPHAGYVFSGPVAASAYSALEPMRQKIRRVVLIGPAHYVAFFGVATTGAKAFQTPLGTVPVDTQTVEGICRAGLAHVVDQAHGPEHSLEVHLPFLQQTLESFSIVPILTGQTTALQVSELLNALWDGPETLIVVSSDLSHYHDYATASDLDRAVSQAIESLAAHEIKTYHACGRLAIQGLLMQAQQRAMRIKTVDLRNSGDTAPGLAGRDRVVGYGAYVLYDQHP